VHAKSTGELISFGFSDRSVQSWSQRNAQLIAESKRKNDFTFWLIFGLILNLGLGESLSRRLIQKVKLPVTVEQEHYDLHSILTSCSVSIDVLLYL